jgi:hypothetical protein
MRHCIYLLATVSGVALASAVFVPGANAAESKVETQIAVVSLEPQIIQSNQTKVICSRHRPLSLSSEGVKLASSLTSQNTDWSSNVIRLFCRDVRINTIVVRDYCALIRQ